MRSKAKSFAAAERLPRHGDLVTCTGCGRPGVHARVLALSECCGRRVRVEERPPPGIGRARRLVAWLRFGVPWGWGA